MRRVRHPGRRKRWRGWRVACTSWPTPSEVREQGFVLRIRVVVLCKNGGFKPVGAKTPKSAPFEADIWRVFYQALVDRYQTGPHVKG